MAQSGTNQELAETTNLPFSSANQTRLGVDISADLGALVAARGGGASLRLLVLLGVLGGVLGGVLRGVLLSVLLGGLFGCGVRGGAEEAQEAGD